jgi:serine/threonine protein kinase
MMHKLGWGEFSTVWLAFDREAIEPRHTFVAIKIAKCHTTVTESSKYEINLLRYLRSQTRHSAPLTQLLDNFEHHGNFGSHLCMVFPVHGSNLLCIIDQMKAKKRRRTDKEVQLVKEITTSILQGLADLEAVNVIHTDIKPENVLCSAPDPKVVQIISQFYSRRDHVSAEAQKAWETGDSNNLVCIADFGLSALLEPPGTANEPARQVGRKKEFPVSKAGIVSNGSGTKIQTREYRAPEILFGTDFCPRSDVWSVGCVVYELITGDFLVDPKRKTRVEREMDIEHLAMIMQILGPVPSRITSLVRSSNPPRYLANYFNEQGQFIYADRFRHYPRRSIAAELEQFLEPSEAERAAQFIMSCFTYDPLERSHASDLLKHSWLRGASF